MNGANRSSRGPGTSNARPMSSTTTAVGDATGIGWPTTGTLRNRFPYVRVGSGPETLVVLPGFGDAMFQGRYPPGSAWVAQPYFAPYLDDFTVYLLSRPRGLPEGYRIRDAAANHARVLDAELGPATVLGISMGGQIALALATRRPDLVERLVLANTAARVDPDERERVEYLRGLARERDWFGIRARLAVTLFSDWRTFAYPPLLRTVGPLVLPRPAEPADVTRSLDAILAFDGRSFLDDVAPPTLLFGGERDPYFTPRVQRETVRGLSNARLRSVPTARHGAFHERKPLFDSYVTEFLSEPGRTDA